MNEELSNRQLIADRDRIFQQMILVCNLANDHLKKDSEERKMFLENIRDSCLEPRFKKIFFREEKNV